MNHARTVLRVPAATPLAVVADLLVYAAASAAGATWQIDAPYDVNAMVVAVATAVPLLAAGTIVSAPARRLPAVRTWAAWAGFGLALVSAAMPFVVSSARRPAWRWPSCISSIACYRRLRQADPNRRPEASQRWDWLCAPPKAGGALLENLVEKL